MGCKKRLRQQGRGLIYPEWWCVWSEWGWGASRSLVASETRSGGIRYHGLFVEETERLGDSGIVRESPSVGQREGIREDEAERLFIAKDVLCLETW